MKHGKYKYDALIQLTLEKIFVMWYMKCNKGRKDSNFSLIRQIFWHITCAPLHNLEMNTVENYTL